MNLNIAIAIWSYLLVNLICIGVIAMLWMQNRHCLSGPGFWLGGLVLQFVGLILISMDGTIPDLLSVVAANVLVLAGAMMIYRGLERYVGRAGHWVHHLVLLGLFASIHTYFTLVQPNLAARIINLSTNVSVIYGECAWLLLRQVALPARQETRGAGLVFVGLALISLLRTVWNVIMRPTVVYLLQQPDMFDVWAILLAQVLLLALTFDLILMVNCRLILEMQTELTERRQAQEALRESAALVRSISDNLPNAMLYQITRHTDGTRQFTYVSDAVQRFYGCTPAEVMADASRIYERVVEQDRQWLWEQEEAAFKAFSSLSAQVRLYNPAGDIRWSYVASSPRRLPGGLMCWDGLEIDITAQKQVEERLKQLAARHEWLARDSYHRVKNNLMVIDVLLDMQAQEIADAELGEAFRQSQSRVRAMLLIHEQLHQSSDLQQIDLATYVRHLAQDLFEAYRTQLIPIDLTIDVQDVFLEADQALACGLILNELVSNALKHAFVGREQGRLAVSVCRQNGHYVLTVSDDGVGLPDGIDELSSDSLGMSIVQAQAHNLGGEIDLDRHDGTTWRVRFAGVGAGLAPAPLGAC